MGAGHNGGRTYGALFTVRTLLARSRDAQFCYIRLVASWSARCRNSAAMRRHPPWPLSAPHRAVAEVRYRLHWTACYSVPPWCMRPIRFAPTSSRIACRTSRRLPPHHRLTVPRRYRALAAARCPLRALDDGSRRFPQPFFRITDREGPVRRATPHRICPTDTIPGSIRSRLPAVPHADIESRSNAARWENRRRASPPGTTLPELTAPNGRMPGAQ
jgi:hypothetical protein